jgi:hypothetical protein
MLHYETAPEPENRVSGFNDSVQNTNRTKFAKVKAYVPTSNRFGRAFPFILNLCKEMSNEYSVFERCGYVQLAAVFSLGKQFCALRVEFFGVL